MRRGRGLQSDEPVADEVFAASAAEPGRNREAHGDRALADDALEMEGGTEAAHRFWTSPMPWLGGKTPAGALADRGGPGAIEDLINRLKYGIPP